MTLQVHVNNIRNRIHDRVKLHQQANASYHFTPYSIHLKEHDSESNEFGSSAPKAAPKISIYEMTKKFVDEKTAKRMEAYQRQFLKAVKKSKETKKKMKNGGALHLLNNPNNSPEIIEELAETIFEGANSPIIKAANKHKDKVIEVIQKGAENIDVAHESWYDMFSRWGSNTKWLLGKSKDFFNNLIAGKYNITWGSVVVGALVILLLWSLLAFFGIISMGPMAVASSAWTYICTWVGDIINTAVGGQEKLLFTNKWANEALDRYASDQVQTRALGCLGSIGGSAATGTGTAVLAGLGKFLGKSMVPGAGWASAIGTIGCVAWSGVMYTRDLYGKSAGGAALFNEFRDIETYVIRAALSSISTYFLNKAYNNGYIGKEALQSMAGIRAGVNKMVHVADKTRRGIEKICLKEMAKVDASADNSLGANGFYSYDTLTSIQKNVLEPMEEKERRGEKVVVGKKQEAAFIQTLAITKVLEDRGRQLTVTKTETNLKF